MQRKCVICGKLFEGYANKILCSIECNKKRALDLKQQNGVKKVLDLKQPSVEKIQERNLTYYEANREKSLKYAKKYYEANREKMSEYARKYREENQEYYKKYYEANREKRLEYARKYREQNNETDNLCSLVNRFLNTLERKEMDLVRATSEIERLRVQIKDLKVIIDNKKS